VKKVLVLVFAALSTPASAATAFYSYTAGLGSSGWTLNSNTTFGDPLYLEADLYGNFFVPLIDPLEYTIESVTMTLNTDAGAWATSGSPQPKYGSYAMTLSSGTLPVSFSDSDSWFSVGSSGEDLLVHNDTPLPVPDVFDPLYDFADFYGTPGNYDPMDVTTIGFHLLMGVGSPAGLLAYAYLDEANIEITYELTNLQLGIGDPNWPTGYGSGNGNWNIQIDPTGIVETVVPVPAAAWLFGSSLGLLGWMRRKAL